MPLKTITLAAWLLLVSSVPSLAQSSVSLFDGHTFTGWETVTGAPVTRGWEVDEGTIHLRADGPRTGPIVTSRQFADFDLQFEWKISTGGNSGVKYRVKKFGDRILGCEFQILDDATHSDIKAKQQTGGIYGLYAPRCLPAHPAGKFNHSRIVVSGKQLQHWLNGKLVVEARVCSCDWRNRKAVSKFAQVDGFGENRCGRIMLTDHSSEVWYRNLTLHPLQRPKHLLLANIFPNFIKNGDAPLSPDSTRSPFLLRRPFRRQ